MDNEIYDKLYNRVQDLLAEYNMPDADLTALNDEVQKLTARIDQTPEHSVNAMNRQRLMDMLQPARGNVRRDEEKMEAYRASIADRPKAKPKETVTYNITDLREATEEETVDQVITAASERNKYMEQTQEQGNNAQYVIIQLFAAGKIPDIEKVKAFAEKNGLPPTIVPMAMRARAMQNNAERDMEAGGK